MYIKQEWEEQLWSYIGGIAVKKGIHPIQIGGIENHIHALVEPPKTMDLPTLLQALKTYSSKWINENGLMIGKFHWQDGYGAFSVSPSQLPSVVRYIKNQRKHHQEKTFEEEYREFMQSHSVNYEDKYLFG